MITVDHSTLLYRASSRCSKGACVEVAFLSNGGAVVRDGKDRARKALVFDGHAWAGFLGGIKDGEFDF